MLPNSASATLLEGLRDRNRRLIGKAITELENNSLVGEQLAHMLLHNPARTSPVFAIGLTGPPGAGKSTLANALVMTLIARRHRVAVLLVDPSSPVTGGALLGDRIRFSQGSRSDALYIRSLGNRGALGGLTASIRSVITALGVAGFDLVLVETVGAGQSDVAITQIADLTVFAIPPGLGDSIQHMKAGLHEVADMFVVTKGDRPGADQLYRQLRASARRLGDMEPRRVILTSSNDGSGVAELADEIVRRTHIKLGGPRDFPDR